jgi:bla regulator protein blaR1
MPKLPRLMGGEGHLTAGAVSMIFLTDWLYRQPEMEGRVIVDETGLKGYYDFELNWTPDESHAPSPNETGGGQGSADAAPRDGPSIFTAFQEQLGLKLVPNKAPVEVLIIDHVEKPSPD